MKTLLSALAIFCGLFTTVNPVFAQTWTQSSAPITTWNSVASSADGTKLFAINYILPEPPFLPASPMYVSTNSGATWNPTELPSYYFNYVACSADGEKVTATSPIYDFTPFWSSSDSGVTWTSEGSFLGPYSEDWSCICCSADGNKIFAANGTNFYVSLDSGATWTPTSTSTRGWSYVAASADGTKLVAGMFDDTVYTSTNSGSSWFAVGPTNEYWWGGVASSADGCKLVAASWSSYNFNNNGIGGPIYTSNDSGLTWIPTSAPFLNWQSVASSADGTKLVAAVKGGQIYASTNSGVTWQAANVPSTNWQSIASSADGNKLVAVVGNGGIWTSQTTPTPQLNLATSNTSLALSWLVPSTNFVLQQSPDLISWSSITDAPALNLTNLNNELTLSPSNNIGFFRLISQ